MIGYDSDAARTVEGKSCGGFKKKCNDASLFLLFHLKKNENRLLKVAPMNLGDYRSSKSGTRHTLGQDVLPLKYM